MSRQSEIREGIERITDKTLQTEEIIQFLHSQDCVIKIFDKEGLWWGEIKPLIGDE